MQSKILAAAQQARDLTSWAAAGWISMHVRLAQCIHRDKGLVTG
ncbi:hypothetical protein [Lacrimispora indolis]|nr:hypothetical protein [[Clostridium] methoxybenzovorans]